MLRTLIFLCLLMPTGMMAIGLSSSASAGGGGGIDAEKFNADVAALQTALNHGGAPGVNQAIAKDSSKGTVRILIKDGGPLSIWYSNQGVYNENDIGLSFQRRKGVFGVVSVNLEKKYQPIPRVQVSKCV